MTAYQGEEDAYDGPTVSLTLQPSHRKLLKPSLPSMASGASCLLLALFTVCPYWGMWLWLPSKGEKGQG